MLPTEVQRILLLIGLAATGYLMILAWNDDFIKIKQQAPAEYRTEEPQPLLDAAVPAVIDGADGETQSDVPDASLIAGSEPARAEPAIAATAPGSRLVKVSTPELNVWIDRSGRWPLRTTSR